MIRVKDVTKYYNAFCAVDRINLEIQKGSIVGLLGPNGAGKTTTLRMLTGFFLPTSGEIWVKEYSIAENRLDIKKLIGYLPESAPIYHNMLVFDYLDYIARIRGFQGGDKIARLHRLADLCGLQEIMHKNVGELSKGLNQRVGLAHAMMNDPEILILDEPTSGLDPNQIVEIRQIIRRIGEEKTVILSTHILSEVEATCDRVVIINRGQIVADDDTEALKRSSVRRREIHLRLLNAPLEDVRERLSGIPGVFSVEEEEADEGAALALRLESESDIDLRENIYGSIKETDWVLIELRQETKTLETIFRELTKEN
ncbi:MAG: ATP-binding cassette domain-containing protein [Pseudomonadota bacterium]